MKTSIIMPLYGKWNMTNARLNEFRTHLPLDCEIIVVDDCSPKAEQDRIRNGIAFWQKSGAAYHSIRFIANEENLGFGASLNRGAEIADGDVLVFHSNDVIVSGDYVTPLIGLYGKQDDKVLVGHRLIWWAAGWNQFESRIVPYLEGYFISCLRECWGEIKWDLRYGKYDYEDVDLSMQAQVLGYNLVELKTDTLKHMGAGTIGSTHERMKHTQHNREVFRDKWKKTLLE